MSFTPPVNAIQYLLNHAIDFDAIMALPKFSDINKELVGDVLSGASVFARDIWAPTNWDGDQNPARLEGSDVKSSPGFKQAYRAFVDAQWQTLSVPAEIGGMGLPMAVSAGVNEMLYSANMALGLCPMLSSSAAKAIDTHASQALQDIYLPKLISGDWSGAMCLTEPQAGSDLGPVRSKAVDNGDGTYSITGQKIYITWGDHDMADNVIHLVLARLPDSPEGSRGISLFLCPKYFVKDDGTLGARNDFAPISLEHKLGIHGSPTCVMQFNGARGWLVGEVNRGLACMFTMMNEARLFVGVQGVAIGERAYQAALQYAHDRVQGRPIGGEPTDPIVHHPDVRRMLMDMKTRLMGARAIAMATAAADDMGHHSRAALLTPIAKSCGSDMGVHVSSMGIQIHGGMGFVEETGAAQHYRDSRIAPIYEGTNGIQAMDLVGRKLRRDGGEAMTALILDMKHIISRIGQVSANLDAHAKQDLSICNSALTQGLDVLETATKHMLKADDKAALAVASPYQTLSMHVISGALLIKAALGGLEADDPLAVNMLELARYHALAIMPLAGAQLDYIMGGSEHLFSFPLDQLADL